MEEGKRSKTVTAVLLNALVLPGAGHILIGYRTRGIILALASIILIILPLIRYATMIAYALSIASMKNPGLVGKTLEATVIVWPEVKSIMLIALAGIIIVWVYGIYDVYVKSRRS